MSFQTSTVLSTLSSSTELTCTIVANLSSDSFSHGPNSRDSKLLVKQVLGRKCLSCIYQHTIKTTLLHYQHLLKKVTKMGNLTALPLCVQHCIKNTTKSDNVEHQNYIIYSVAGSTGKLPPCVTSHQGQLSRAIPVLAEVKLQHTASCQHTM